MGTTQKTLSFYLHENLKFGRYFWSALALWPLGVALQSLILPLIAARALNLLIQTVPHPPQDYWMIFLPYLIAFLLAGAVGQAFAYGALMLLSKLETYVRPTIQNKLYNLLLKHSLSFHNNTFSGALVNQVTKFTTSYIGLTDTFFLSILELIVKFLVAIVILAFFSWPIALAMLTWSIVFMFINYTLTKKRIYLSKRAAAADTVLTAHLADSMSNVAAIKAFAREADEAVSHSEKAWDRSNKKYASWVRATQNGSITALLMILLQFIVLVMSIYGVMSHHLQIGTLLLAQVYTAQLISVLWGFSGLTRNIEQYLADAEEMTEILGQDVEVQDAETAQKLHVDRGEINFNDVSFRHTDAQEHEHLFQHFSLRIAPGEKIGLVGHSGSGKTTLTRLLLRFSDIQAGSITIDGQDISHVQQSDLRAQIAYVPQEPLLFHRSIRENIAYGRPDATEEQIHHAAEQAHAHEFIAKLPKGYDTLVGERGVKLSGGQRQRIAIARAILKDAPILLLDEATSALDSESEKLIQDALKKLMQHRTTIVIAHRLSTIQKMDRIVVLENGRITEQGSHAELLEHRGEYAKLWAHQSGGFIED